jgi:DNA-binding protein YbaB
MNHEALLKLLGVADYPPVEVSADGVTVTMDTFFRVSGIVLRNVTLEKAEAARLEQALITAINQAFRQVAGRNAERVAQSFAASQRTG